MSNSVLKYLAPYINKVFGFKRDPSAHWRLDPVASPSIRHVSAVNLSHFERHLISERDNESGFRDMRKSYRILCLDGGGVRGILTTTVLERIVEHNPNFLSEVDFVIGTSAGGILALLLASGYTPRECTDIYKWGMPHIFGHDPYRAINPFKAKYCHKAKEEIFKDFFGNRTMLDLEKTCSVVAFRIDGKKSGTHSFFNKEGWRPAVFSNMPRAHGMVEPDSDLMVWDAAMRTSAAPTYFPVYKGYIDGGIVANNPSIIAVTKALAHFPLVTLRNVSVLSIGAGGFPRHTKVDLGGNDWGVKQWIPNLLDLLLDGDSVTIDLVMHYLLDNGGMYHRLDPMLSRQIALDDVSAMDELVQIGRNVDLGQTIKFVDEHYTYHDFASQDDTMTTNSLDHATHYHDAWEKFYVAKEKKM